MDLKRYLPGNDEDRNIEYLWAVVIEPKFVQAAIWCISGETAQIVYTSNPTSWETNEDLVNSTDSALSAAILDFPDDLKEPSKTVFGVISSWVSEGQINEEYLEKIKQICKELSLKPAGFVVLSEAIAYYLKSEEGSPLNSILIGVYEDKLEVSLFKLGNLTGSARVARSVSMVDDVVEGLTRFNNTGAFPSRFILYNAKEQQLEDAQQSLIQANWDEYDSVKFLHPPKIEIMSTDNKIDAVSLAGAAEMSEVEKVERVKLVGSEAKAPKEDELEEQEVTTEKDENSELKQDTLSPEEVGFSVGDAAGNIEPSSQDEHKDSQYSQDTPQINYPDHKDEDIENVVPVDNEELSEVQTDDAPDDSKKKLKFKNPLKNVGLSMSLFVNPFKKFVGLFSGGSQLKKIFAIGFISFVLLFAAGVALWWYVPKATVTVYLSPQQQNERVEIYIDPDEGDVNIKERTLPGEIVSTTVSDERTISTTGTKRVGERATGEVTLYRVGTEITLEEGTVLRGPSNLRFTLNDDVSVASGSAGTPGTTTANVTAEDIGAEYNLASGSTFTVGNYSDSDIEAKNESEFSGGTSREINAVSERDMVNLEEELSEELSQRAIEQLDDELSEDQILVEDSMEETVEDKSFSADVGDEAETLKLSITKSVEASTVNRSQLIALAKDVLKNKVPDGYVLRDENIDVNFTLDEETEGVFKFDTRVTANLLPQADPDEIKSNIKGKYPAVAQEYLNRNIPGFVRAEITVNPSLPGRLNTLPRMAKNIEIEISAEQ